MWFSDIKLTKNKSVYHVSTTSKTVHLQKNKTICNIALALKCKIGKPTFCVVIVLTFIKKRNKWFNKICVSNIKKLSYVKKKCNKSCFWLVSGQATQARLLMINRGTLGKCKVAPIGNLIKIYLTATRCAGSLVLTDTCHRAALYGYQGTQKWQINGGEQTKNKNSIFLCNHGQICSNVPTKTRYVHMPKINRACSIF